MADKVKGVVQGAVIGPDGTVITENYKRLDERFDKLEARLNDSLTTRVAEQIALLEAERVKVQSIRQLATVGASAIVAASAVLGWLGWNTYNGAISDVTDSLKSEIAGAKGEFKDIAQLAEDYDDVRSQISGLSEQTEIYMQLFTTKDGDGNPSIFEPLYRYSELDREIESKREISSIWRFAGQLPEDSTIDDTFYSAGFRLRAARIFERLIQLARSDIPDDKSRVSADLLYNAAANASIVEMESHAGLLAEAAVNLVGDPSAELILRSLRFSSGNSEKQRKEILAEAETALKKMSRFHAHQALSEMYNIAVNLGDIAEVVDILERVTPDRARTAYYHFLVARLIQMIGLQGNQAKIATSLSNGIDKLIFEHDETDGKISAVAQLSRVLEADGALFLSLDQEKADAITQEARSVILKNVPRDLLQSKLSPEVWNTVSAEPAASDYSDLPSNLLEHPEFETLMEDPGFLEALEDPEFREALEDPGFLDFLIEIK